MSRSNPPSRPGSSSSSRPHASESPSSSSHQQPDYSSAFGSGGVAYLKTRDVASAPTTRHSTPQPLHATPGVKITHAKPKSSHHGGGAGAVVSDLLGGGSKGGAKAKAGGGGDSNGKKPEKRSEKAEALEIKIRDVESLVFDEAGGSSAATVVLGKRALKKGKGGCFCQARIHPLNTYTPLCPSCSLPLCVLQLPHLPCPSCFSSLLTPVSRTRLLATLNDELDSLLASEQRERDRLEELRKESAWRESAGGKFPVLAAGIVKGTKDRAKVEDHAPGRKVMSMNAKTGRFEVKTFVKKPRSEAVDDSDGGGGNTSEGGGPSRVASPELFEGRIKAPRMEYPTRVERVEHVREVLGERQKERRFFLDVGGLELEYVEPRKILVVEEDVSGEKKGKGRKRGRGKGKGKEVEQDGEGSSSRFDGDEFVDEGPSQQDQTSAARDAGPDDLTAEERAWMGLPPLPTTSSRPPNPTTPAFVPSSISSSNTKPNPTPASSSYPPPPSPQRAPPLSQPTPQRRAAPPHLPASTKVDIPSSIQFSSSGLPSSSQQSNGRFSVSHPPPSRLLEAGVKVLVIKKEDQGSGKTTFGEVAEVLTRGDHPRGVKVRCKGGMVGRVVALV